jgi:hypothetical protein
VRERIDHVSEDCGKIRKVAELAFGQVGLKGSAFYTQRTLKPQFMDSFEVRAAALLDSQQIYPASR